MNYEKWLETELANANEITRRVRKKTVKNMIIAVPIVMLVMCGIGFLGGRIEGAVNNIKYGLMFLVFVELVFLLTGLLPNLAKRIMKLLKKEVMKELVSDSEREEFSRQMLGGDGTGSIRKITGINSDKMEVRILVTRDYAYYSCSNGIASIVRLKDVERVETDASEFTNYIKTGNQSVRVTNTMFPINFYYHKPDDTKKKKYFDKVFMLDSRDLRDQVIRAIRELNEETA